MSNAEQAALGFFSEAGGAGTLDKLIDGFSRVARPLGFSSAACFRVAKPGEPICVRLVFGWNLDHQTTGRLCRRLSGADSAIQAALMSQSAVAWSDIEPGADGGLVGWLIPVHGPLGETLCVSVLGEADVSLDPKQRMILQVAATFLASRGVALAEFEAETSIDPRPTRRETECAYWFGEGKTDWEIGQMLNLSEGAVALHLRSLKQKLNLARRSDIPARFRRIDAPMDEDG